MLIKMVPTARFSACLYCNLYLYLHPGGGGGGSDIRSLSSIRPICRCRCPPLQSAPLYLSTLVSQHTRNQYLRHSVSLSSPLFVFHICMCVVPQASEKEGQVRLDHSPAPTQLALLSPICFPRSKRPIAATHVTLNDLTPQ